MSFLSLLYKTAVHLFSVQLLFWSAIKLLLPYSMPDEGFYGFLSYLSSVISS